MNKALINRIGKALMFSIVLTGILYATHYERYDHQKMKPALAITLVVFLRFLIFLGVLNLLNFLKNRKQQ